MTIGRIALVPLFVAAFFLPGDSGRWIVFGLFCLAAATDAADGIIARKLNAESSFGRMLDPIADKLNVSAALLMLAADHTMQGLQLIPALVILCREIMVSGLREFLAGADVSLPVTRVAKLKTVMQVVAIAALIGSSASERMLPGVTAVALVGLWVAAGLTFYTGYAYFRAGLIHARSQPLVRGPSRRAWGPAPSTEPPDMRLLYFAWVRQKIGLAEEDFTAPASVATVAQLIEVLAAQGPGYQAAFSDVKLVRCAVNQQHAGLEAVVKPDDEVAFFPPVTGG